MVPLRTHILAAGSFGVLFCLFLCRALRLQGPQGCGALGEDVLSPIQSGLQLIQGLAQGFRRRGHLGLAALHPGR